MTLILALCFRSLHQLSFIPSGKWNCL